MMKFLPDPIRKFACSLPRQLAREEAPPPLLMVELTRLRSEIARLNELVSDLTLDNVILRDVARLCSVLPQAQAQG